MNLRDYYIDLVTPEHKAKPKYKSMLDALLKPNDDIFDLCIVFDSEFDIYTATGSQLDILGQFIGVSRQVSYDPTVGDSSILNDDLYRIVLLSTLFKNGWRGGTDDLNESWKTIMPSINLGIIDHQDMTMDAFVVGSMNQSLIDLINKGYIIPKPLGVGVKYSISSHALFGYDTNNATVKGYDEGYWGSSAFENN